MQVMEFDLRSLEESLRKLNGLAQRKGIEEVRARQEHRTRTEHRDACVTARDEATQWAAKCREHEQKRRRIRTRVLEVRGGRQLHAGGADADMGDVPVLALSWPSFTASLTRLAGGHVAGSVHACRTRGSATRTW